MKINLYLYAFSLMVLKGESVVDARSLEIEKKMSASRLKSLSASDKEIRKGKALYLSDISASESEEQSPSPQLRTKGFRRLWEKYGFKKKPPQMRGSTYSTSSNGDTSGYDTDDPDVGSPVSLHEVKFDLSEETSKPSDKSRRRSRLESVVSPLTVQILEKGEAERALRKVLEQKADYYEEKGESFTRDIQEFQEIVDQFIADHSALGSMSPEERKGFIKAYARSSAGTSPLKPTRKA